MTNQDEFPVALPCHLPADLRLELRGERRTERETSILDLYNVCEKSGGHLVSPHVTHPHHCHPGVSRWEEVKIFQVRIQNVSQKQR